MNVAAESDILYLFSKITAGDQQAFAELFNNHYDAVFSTAIQYCKIKTIAEDVVQAVFIDVWEKRSGLSDVENAPAWLRTVTRNKAITALKKESRQEQYKTAVKELFETEENTPLQQLILRQKQELIQKILNSLPARQKQVYTLSRYDGGTYAEIGKGLGISAETVKEHMAKALKTIREMMLAHKTDLLIALFCLLFYFF